MAEDVYGMNDLLAQFGKMGDLVEQKKIIARAVRKGAMLIAEEAEHRAPKRRGKLAASEIVMVTEQTATEAIAKIGPSSKAFYGYFQEFGTIHNSPRPFLRPAWDAKIDEAIAIIAYMISKEIDEAAA